MTTEQTHPLVDKIHSERGRIFDQLSQIVAFDSVHNQPGHEDDNTSAAHWVRDAFTEAGLDTELIPTSDGSVLVRGTRLIDASLPTVLLYSHYDIVPTGDHAAWQSHPLTLTERDGRWYGRGAADCKGNLVMHLAALRAVESEGGPKVNVTVIIEGSEERGGAGLDDLIETRPELFQADAILIADTGNAAVGKPTLTTSLRGGAQVTVTVDTLRTPAHSGMVGGAAPDAVAALMRLLDSLRDETGATRIDGLDTSATWDGELYDPETFRSDAGVLEGVELFGGSDNPAHLIWARPAVTVTGFTSTPVSEAVNAVPATASAKINLRVPHPLDSTATVEALVRHLENHVPWGAHLSVEVDDINPPFATDTSSAAAQTLSSCLAESYGEDEVALVGSGGSIPLAKGLQRAVPGASIALFGVEEPLSTIHSPNESVDPSEIEHLAAAEALFLLRYQGR
ncbi:dipeptidase [Corynebacterium doosanense]|uniref:Peptidase M20 n=1 Tax=Corynebacterium doosanense CAU 212 = DSM 45436 TaxID=558173 RepID=A0A097IIB7_9CORY|nr:dipeptidase [Corynebacterium doosanense]AIT61873.1 peptidase M20 [Corynebacterium doosanense CAU 212 = DSM 45436]